MRIAYRLMTIAVFPILILASMPATASQIPIGINFGHNILIQEIWQGTTPLLCLSNGSAHDRIVQVARWRSRTVAALPLQQWRVESNSVRCYDASALGAGSLLEFSLVDGARLGLLRAPGVRPRGHGNPSGIASFQGPNSSCTSPGTWLEQNRLWLTAGEPASITLYIAVGSEGLLLELPVDSGIGLPHLPVIGASSQTLKVTQRDGRLLIAGDGAGAFPVIHQLHVELDVPPVNQPAMFLLSGRKRIVPDGWQCFLRGLMVRPAPGS